MKTLGLKVQVASEDDMVRISTLFSLVMMILFSACTTKDAPPETVQLDLGTFEGSCKIDTERLKKMLDVYVYGEIDCIASNLKQFSDFVQRQDPAYIDRPDLDKFIAKFYSSSHEQMVKSLRLLFDVNTLFMADRPDSIALVKIKPLFDLVKTLNRYGVPLNQIFKGITEKNNYWEVRGQILALFNQLSAELKSSIAPYTSAPRTVDLMSMIRRFKEGLDLTDDQLKPEVIEDYLFVKKLLLGGNPRSIDTSELFGLLSKLPDLAITAFDMIYIKERPDQGTTDKFGFYLDTFARLRSTFHNLAQNDEIFTHTELMEFGDELFPKDGEINFRNMEPSIINIKQKLIGTDPASYQFGDLNKVLNWGQDVLEQLYFNQITYEHLSAIMENGKKLEEADLPALPDLPGYKRFERARLFAMWDEFRFTVINFRQFHSPESIIYFTNSHYRSVFGLNLKSVIRYGLSLALNAYGHGVKDPVSGKVKFMAATLDELRNLLLDLSHIMKEIDLWPKYFERFLSEANNSSDLFQHHADGDGVISFIEATDYVSNIISSRTIALDMKDALATFCPIVPDEDGEDAFEVPCYRKNLFKSLFGVLNYRKYFQKLYDYTVHYPASEIEKYIKDVESFAKEERDTSIPMSIVDIGRLFVSFGNIEATMLRYDNNNTNILERNEVDLGFLVFKKTLIAFGNLKPSQEALAKSIYLYILKKMKAPKPIALLAFHVFGKKKNISARRMNIGAILALVAEATIPQEKD